MKEEFPVIVKTPDRSLNVMIAQTDTMRAVKEKAALQTSFPVECELLLRGKLLQGV